MSNSEQRLIGDSIVEISGQGPAIVFVHGFTTTAEFWREQVAPFSRDRRVIRVNLPGHGVSPRPEERGYAIDDFVVDLERVFTELAIEPCVLVGLSMGGTIAQRFVLKNPPRVNALVLVGATPHGLGPDVKVENVLTAIDRFGVAIASQHVIERSFAACAPASIVDWAKNEVVQTPAHVARVAIRSLNASDSRSELSSIRIPTLVVVGEEDAITPPAESRALADGIPDSWLTIIPNAAHFPMIEQPHIFNAKFSEFLNSI
ncbi:pimeloyl-ACP methyl ester carboxylesterase [Methylorubrum rhodinum]|uniref:Pimeloyl-ACP methyl ester carboxylesterase n=1 Tax=Methylorubrum rhodinum TaxID=29428 RepID=A0A840ZFF8_9HYPH|nr:alpha/beta fold hydrolase [Methylorubrum rhodinum]MBB5756479.1 pimeloyl-ACP methyl ester carboxylesterase [Methylorubrum rhodinum]